MNIQPQDIAKPLSDIQFDQLNDLLDKRRAAMNLEAIDGFFSALHCAPDLVMPSQYLDDILGDQSDDANAFESEEQAQTFFSLLMQHWNHVGKQLREEDVYLPLLLEDDQGDAHGNDWAKGFLQGMEHNQDEWQILLDDEEQGGALVSIFALAHEHDPDPELRPYAEPITNERREGLLTGIAAGATIIYRYFEQHRHFSAQEKTHTSTYRRESSKVGRNMPCPCGSGKKYKKCCYKTTVH